MESKTIAFLVDSDNIALEMGLKTPLGLVTLELTALSDRQLKVLQDRTSMLLARLFKAHVQKDICVPKVQMLQFHVPQALTIHRLLKLHASLVRVVTTAMNTE